MLGRSTAYLFPAPQRWILRLWGVGDIHARQKWAAVWPFLARLPHCGVRLLDAGCGAGSWTLEIAARRPNWQVTGVDIDASRIREAERKRRKLDLTSAAFLTEDFLRFEPTHAMDVVLSVASAHYLARAGRGEELFERFGKWLRPGGLLILYGPRACAERPLLPFLKPVGGEWGFGAEDLRALARHGGFAVSDLLPQVEAWGAAAKQISKTFGQYRAGRLLTYPLQAALSGIGGMARQDGSRSVAYLLIAAKSPANREGDGTLSSRERPASSVL